VFISFWPQKETEPTDENTSPWLHRSSAERSEAQEKLSGFNKIAKNFLGSIALDKLLATLVEQYLRNRFSYSFLHAIF
jgi:hypothetical protein